MNLFLYIVFLASLLKHDVAYLAHSCIQDPPSLGLEHNETTIFGKYFTATTCMDQALSLFSSKICKVYNHQFLRLTIMDYNQKFALCNNILIFKIFSCDHNLKTRWTYCVIVFDNLTIKSTSWSTKKIFYADIYKNIHSCHSTIF